MSLGVLLCVVVLQGPQGAMVANGIDPRLLAGGSGGYVSRPGIDSIRQEIDLLFMNSTTGNGLLTPGEFVEWTVEAKQGQYIASQADSTVFDPALQILGPDGKVIAENDDRYPGDQRPLVLATAKTDGLHLIRARSFRDRSGGPVSARIATWDCQDLEIGKPTPVRFLASAGQLLRVSLKAGQAVQFTYREGPRGIVRPKAIYHGSGVPLTVQRELRDLEPGLILAPIDGEYLVCLPASGGGTALLESLPMLEPGQPFESSAAIARVFLKAGQLVRVGVTGPVSGQVAFVESPLSAKYDVKSANLHPFLPKPENAVAFQTTTGREGDRRHQVLFAKRDTELWMLAVPGRDPAASRYSTFVQDAWTNLPEGGRGHSGRLPVGDTHYFRYPAKQGEVYLYELRAADFRPALYAVTDTGGPMHWGQYGELDRDVHSWVYEVGADGYTGLRLSGMGNGGGGAYRLSRTRVLPRTIEGGKPLEGKIQAEEAQLVEIKVPAKLPLVVKWTSDRWGYEVRYLTGRALQVRESDPNTVYAFLLEPEDRLIRFILQGREACKYRIELRLADRPPQ